MSESHRYALVGGFTLLPQGIETEAVILIEDGVIMSVGSETGHARVVDARGLHVLPASWTCTVTPSSVSSCHVLGCTLTCKWPSLKQIASW